MGDTVEYQRKEAIQPQQSPTNFPEALKGGSAYQDSIHAADIMGDIGMTIAQNASNEMARSAGIEAAQSGKGKFLWPAITESDKEFVNAYKNELSRNLDFNGKSYLNKILSQADAIKNPTAEVISTYQKNALTGIEPILNEAPEDMQPELRRSLMSAYESGLYQITGKVQRANNERMAAQYALSFKQDSEGVYNNERLGLKDIANQYYEKGIQSIKNNPALNVLEKREQTHELFMRKKAGQLDAEIEKHLKEGTFNEFASKFRGTRPDNLTPEEHDKLSVHMMQYATQYEAAFGASQAANFINAQAQLAKDPSKFNAQDWLPPKISEDQFAQLNYKLQKATLKEYQAADVAESFKDHGNDPRLMGKLTDKQFNAGFEKHVALVEKQKGMQPGTLSYQAQVGLAKNIQRENPGLKDKLARAILSSNPAQSVDAMLAYNNAAEDHDLSLDGLDKDAIAKATKFKYHVLAGNTMAEAWAKTQDFFATESPETREGHKQKFKDLTRFEGDRDLSSYDKMNKQAEKVMEFGVDLPAGFSAIWRNEMESNFAKLGDWDQAAAMTKDTISRVWGVTEINGFKRVMYLWPEKWAKNLPHGTNLFRNQIFNEAKLLVDEYKKLYDSEDSDFYYEIAAPKHMPTEVENAALSLTPTHVKPEPNILKDHDIQGQINIRQIFRHKEVIDGYLVIDSDTRTAQPTNGMMPNYFVGVVSKKTGIALPIYDPRKKMSPMRWQPDTTLAIEESMRLNKLEHEFKFKAVDAAKVLRSKSMKYGDIDIDTAVWQDILLHDDKVRAREVENLKKKEEKAKKAKDKASGTSN